MADYRQPLLPPRSEDIDDHEQRLVQKSAAAAEASFAVGAGDIQPIRSLGDFSREFLAESGRLWFLAGPAIFMCLCQYSLGAVTQVFAGQVGTLELAAVSVENSVIASFSSGTMLGMGSALETLCGQAYGAGQLDMLGVYLQRSWVILLATSLLLSLLYVFAGPFLLLIGQEASLSAAAGVFTIWMLPQLFAFALNFPMVKFLQAQSKMAAIAAIAAAALVLHVALSWVLTVEVGMGVAGLAVALNVSWWFIDVAQLAYVVSGRCGRAWSGFTWKAFTNLWGFVKLSLASAVMICLEVWYFMVLILFAGYLKDAEVAVDALSICMTIVGWTVTAAFGMNAAVSVRISNELGAAHPRTAKLALVVAVISSFMVGIALALLLILTRDHYPALFSNDLAVQRVVTKMTPLLALCIVLNNVQPVLSGVAVGAGWQAVVAYVNIASYYLFGIPLGLILGYKSDMGITGIWLGMMAGTAVQTLVLYWMIYKTNWNEEASNAGDQIRKWGGGNSHNETTNDVVIVN
ncbi:unnamed protein product [Linum tenue]|uniref:Protein DETOXIFICATION n=2 Tax=Linum tenue TaxID=586396 RepID=A0AAV0NY96_9ROSI|nr:unnamed protein product [Linum tenue]